MKEVLEFIKANWQLIVAALVFILSFILQLIKKKPIKDIFDSLYVICVSAVKDCEDSCPVSYKGTAKLNYCLNLVKNRLLVEFPNLNVDLYDLAIKQIIEKILETPHKKGGSADGEKKTHDEK